MSGSDFGLGTFDETLQIWIQMVETTRINLFEEMGLDNESGSESGIDPLILSTGLVYFVSWAYTISTCLKPERFSVRIDSMDQPDGAAGCTRD